MRNTFSQNWHNGFSENKIKEYSGNISAFKKPFYNKKKQRI